MAMPMSASSSTGNPGRLLARRGYERGKQVVYAEIHAAGGRKRVASAIKGRQEYDREWV
jgi:hypothetical protein